jgi:GT2 family glycosyltransferase
MKALISIALYNQLPFTKDCLRYLFKNTDPKLFELAIIDNASTDGTREWLKNDFANSKEYKNVNTVIYFNDKNAGFSYAHNQAGKENECDAIILLNNDTIPLKGWLEPLLEALERPEIGIAGSKLISPKFIGCQHAGIIFLPDGRPYHRYLGYPDNAPEVNKSELVPAVTGACFAVKKELWDLLGGLDLRYFCGWEDIAFCLLARERGYKVWYEPKSVLYHFEGQTAGRYAREDANRELFFKEWAEKIALWGNKDYENYKKELKLKDRGPKKLTIKEVKVG